MPTVFSNSRTRPNLLLASNTRLCFVPLPEYHLFYEKNPSYHKKFQYVQSLYYSNVDVCIFLLLFSVYICKPTATNTEIMPTKIESPVLITH